MRKEVKYYSDNPNITEGFDSEEELKSAEQKYDEQMAELKKKNQNRKTDYELVEAAYRAYIDKQKEANELRVQAVALQNEFITKYGQMYLTLSTPTSIDELCASMFLW